MYGPGIEIPFDDRVLAHVQLVITTKLRRGESFTLQWHDEEDGGRNAIWIDRSVPLYFRYAGSKMPTINREWLEELVMSASSAQGLLLTAEPRPGESTA